MIHRYFIDTTYTMFSVWINSDIANSVRNNTICIESGVENIFRTRDVTQYHTWGMKAWGELGGGGWARDIQCRVG